MAGGHLRRPQRITVRPHHAFRPGGRARSVLDMVRPTRLWLNMRQWLLRGAKILEALHTARNFDCRRSAAVGCGAGDPAKRVCNAEDHRKMPRLRQDNACSTMGYEVAIFLSRAPRVGGDCDGTDPGTGEPGEQ